MLEVKYELENMNLEQSFIKCFLDYIESNHIYIATIFDLEEEIEKFETEKISELNNMKVG